MQPEAFIDAWDPATYPDEIVELAQERAHSDNPIDFKHEVFLPALNKHFVRGWHFTRLCNFEMRKIETEGIQLTSMDLLKRRLGALVDNKEIDRSTADEIISHSPLSSSDGGIGRHGTFHMSGAPFPITDVGVVNYLKYWGGEVSFMYIKDTKLSESLKNVGLPYIIEIVAQVSQTDEACALADCIFEKFDGRKACCNFDIKVSTPLPATSVRKIHLAEDLAYQELNKKLMACDG